MGSISRTFSRYPHLGPVLPAMGCRTEQVHELEETISRVECDLVVIATPVDLRRLIWIMQPTVRATYSVEDRGIPTLAWILQGMMKQAKQS